ncbi:MAG: peptidoglycan DD-metalloendopeptidase family protein [Bacteroidales bacterium]|jgi:septal ring factor EnvC (AmiA/AmiB activator)
MLHQNRIRFGFILILLCLLFFFNTLNLSYSQSKDKLQKDKSKIEKDIEYTNKLLKETKKNKQISLSQLMILNNKISMREDLIEALSEDITGLDNKILSTSSIIKNLEQQLHGLKDEYAQMIYYANKNRSSYNILLFIFSAKDFNQAYKRLKYMQQYSKYRKEQAEMIIKTEMKLSQKVSELKEKKNSKETILKNKETEKEKLSREKEEKNIAVKKLKVKEKELIATLKEKEKAAKKLQRAIESIIAEEIRKSTEVKKAKKVKDKIKVKDKEEKNVNSIYELTPEEQIISDDFANNKGKLPWPSEKGVIVSSFGSHPHLVLPNVKINNNGIDIGTNQGATCRAIFSGKVTGIVSIPGANKAVIVRHGNYLTVYSNLFEVYVKMGENIKTKQNIGKIYTDPSDSKTELHFEIWNGKKTLDPSLWISRK